MTKGELTVQRIEDPWSPERSWEVSVSTKMESGPEEIKGRVCWEGEGAGTGIRAWGRRDGRTIPGGVTS